jgi:O-antigen ligase
MVLSQSRTSILALAIALLVVLSIRRPTRVLIAGVVVALAALVIALLDIDVADVAALISRTGHASEIATLTGRTDIWGFYIAEILKEPFLGYGYGSSKYLMPLLYRTAWGWTTTHAHNMWIQVAFTTGIIGLALLMLVIYSQFRGWTRTRDHITLGVLAFMLVRGLAEAGQTGAGAPGLLVVIWTVWLVGTPLSRSQFGRSVNRTSEWLNPHAALTAGAASGLQKGAGLSVGEPRVASSG